MLFYVSMSYVKKCKNMKPEIKVIFSKMWCHCPIFLSYQYSNFYPFGWLISLSRIGNIQSCSSKLKNPLSTQPTVMLKPTHPHSQIVSIFIWISSQHLGWQGGICLSIAHKLKPSKVHSHNLNERSFKWFLTLNYCYNFTQLISLKKYT